MRKSYGGSLTAEERAEVGRLLEDEKMRRLYEEVGDDEYLTAEFRRYARYEPQRGYRKFRGKMQQQRMRRSLVRWSVAAGLIMSFSSVWLAGEWGRRVGEEKKIVQTVVEPGSCRAVAGHSCN